MSFEKYVYPCNQQPNQDVEHFCHLKEFPMSYPVYPFSLERQPPFWFSNVTVLPTFKIHINGIINMFTFWGGEAGFSQSAKCFWFASKQLHVSIICSCLLLSHSSWYEYTTIVCPFTCWWVGLSQAQRLLSIKLLWIFLCMSFCAHMFSFLLGTYLRIDLLSQRADVWTAVMISHSGYNIMSEQECVRIHVIVHPSQYLVLSNLILAILVGLK